MMTDYTLIEISFNAIFSMKSNINDPVMINNILLIRERTEGVNVHVSWGADDFAGHSKGVQWG